MLQLCEISLSKKILQNDQTKFNQAINFQDQRFLQKELFAWIVDFRISEIHFIFFLNMCKFRSQTFWIRYFTELFVIRNSGIKIYFRIILFNSKRQFMNFIKIQDHVFISNSCKRFVFYGYLIFCVFTKW